MNRKIIATIAVLAMVFAGVAVTMDGTDAAGETAVDKGMILVPYKSGEANTATAEFAFTESELEGYDYTVTIAADENSGDISTSDGDYTTLGTVFYTSDSRGAFSATEGLTSSDNFTMTAASSEANVFQISVKALKAGYTGTVIIRCSAVVTLDNGEKVDIQPIYYQYKVTTVENAAQGSGDVQLSIVIGDLTEAEVGKPYSHQVSVTTTGITADDLYWYATGLPAGLSMSSDGHITGVPLEPVSGGDNVKIVASDKNGNYHFNITATLNVNAQDVSDDDSSTGELFLYKVKVNENGAEVTNPTSVTAYNGDKVTITVTDGGSAATSATVTVISEGTSTTEAAADDGIVTLSDLGTGTYKVVITNNGVVESFYLYVLPVLEDVDANITITGN